MGSCTSGTRLAVCRRNQRVAAGGGTRFFYASKQYCMPDDLLSKYTRPEAASSRKAAGSPLGIWLSAPFGGNMVGQRMMAQRWDTPAEQEP